MGKIKVLYIVSTLRSSGPTNQLLGKISNLDKKKFEAKVLTLSPDPSNNRRDDFVAANIELDSLNLSRVQFQLKGKTLLKQYISAYNPDIVHTTGVRSDIAVSKLKVESKHCMTIRNYAFDDYVAKYGNFIGKIAAKSSSKAMQKCEYVICCSKSLKEMYSEILPQELFVVQNGVDTIKYAPLDKKESKINLRESLALPTDKVIITAVGSLIKRKAPISIINAFKNANKENNAVLLMLGDGDLMEDCKKIADNNVLLKGNVKNVNDYLKASDIYVSASESEGLPNSVLEAGRCGLNMILSDIPQHREVFENNLDYITLFNVGDDAGLSEAMHKKIAQNNSSINFEIAKFIEVNFANEVMSKKYQEIYDSMI